LNGNSERADFHKRGFGLSKIPEDKEKMSTYLESVISCSRKDDDDKLERLKREHDERMKEPIPIVQQIRTVLLPPGQYLSVNWLLLLSPVGFALSYTHTSAISTFIINFLAIFPYATIILLAGDELNIRSGPVLGSLLFVSVRYIYLSQNSWLIS
jgi:hypothetical protein